MTLAEAGKLAAFVLPLGVDTFAVAAAIGAAGIRPAARVRITALFIAFEGGMPLIGLGLGAPVAKVIGSAADYLAAAVLIALGAWMLLVEDRDREEERKAGSLADARGWAMIALGLSISMDELAIGFTLGLSRLPAPMVIIALAFQAGIAAQLGLRLGARLSERSREWAEKAAAIALIGLGLYLLIEQLLRSNR